MEQTASPDSENPEEIATMVAGMVVDFIMENKSLIEEFSGMSQNDLDELVETVEEIIDEFPTEDDIMERIEMIMDLTKNLEAYQTEAEEEVINFINENLEGIEAMLTESPDMILEYFMSQSDMIVDMIQPF